MAFVVDCSVAARWFHRGEANDYTRALLHRVETEAIHVPALFPYEFANVFRKAVSQERLKLKDARAFIALGERLPVVIDPRPVLMTTLFNLGRRFNLSAYDAAYLELAMHLAVPLATVDSGLAQAADKAGCLLRLA